MQYILSFSNFSCDSFVGMDKPRMNNFSEYFTDSHECNKKDDVLTMHAYSSIAFVAPPPPPRAFMSNPGIIVSSLL